ncbi:MAG: helicase C-terminal domain-containing protein [Desulfobacteraceae bacterium]|jgi:Rad3-related DNA helicase
MRCKCGFHTPFINVNNINNNKTCLKCGGELIQTAKEWLSEPNLGLVKEIRSGQITIANTIEQTIKEPGTATVLAEGGCGVGKAQPVWTKILCPGRWRMMGDMEVGMPICDSKGGVQYITGVFPQGMKETFKVVFNDGTAAECCDDHLWFVQTKEDRAAKRKGGVLSLSAIRKTGLKDGNTHKFYVPLMKPVDFATKTLPLSPYFLGVLLGADFKTDMSVGTRAIHVPIFDKFILNEIHKCLTFEDAVKQIIPWYYSIVDGVHSHTRRSHTINVLDSLCLLHTACEERFVPRTYEWSNQADRIALLQGLCDTAGVVRNNKVLLVNASYQVVNDVCFIVQSLGGTATLPNSDPDVNGFYHTNISLSKTIIPFRLPKKQREYKNIKNLPRRAIKEIISLGKEQVQCISVSGKEGLYITDNCIVTHNTYAYLVPAIQAGQHEGMRTVIVTAKKNLQDQLAKKDIPQLRKIIGAPSTYVSLKGKSNYLCKKQLRRNKALFDKHDKGALWNKLKKWSEEDYIGDLDNFSEERVFPVSTVTVEECVGKCLFSRKGLCGYRYVRNQIKEANVVVANHSLLGFDLRFGTGRLFGLYNILVVDEAHACPNYLRRAFADELSETWLKTMLQRVGGEQIDTPSINEKQAIRDWEALFQSIPDERLLPPGFFNEKQLGICLRHLGVLRKDLEDYAIGRWMNKTIKSDKRPTITEIAERCEENILRNAENKGLTIDDDNPELDALYMLLKLYDKIIEARDVLRSTTVVDANYITNKEMIRNGKTKIVRQPVNLAPLVRKPLNLIDKTIFTSATLNNTLLKTELGVEPKVELTQPSPFNYKANSLIYLPKHLPRPHEDNFAFAAAKEINQLVNASKGNALILFTARKDLNRIHEVILRNFHMSNTPIFAQTETQRPAEIMRSFRQTKNSVIFGLRSFFEGIDIQGEKLRLVILVKLPFPHIKDPLCEAKKQRLGSRWWNDYYYPMMLDEVRQAAGRLIRTHLDKGVFCILDTRIWTGSNKNINPMDVGTQKMPWKGYGHKIFKALPFENYTPNRDLVMKYLRKITK